MELDPSWSLNRVVIADLPGLGGLEDVKGKTAYELLSAQALARLIRERRISLRLGPQLSDHQLRLAFDACLESEVSSIQESARKIAQTFGRYLGYVLLTLKRGDQINRDARPEWNRSHWSQWAGIKRAWLGGGLVSGHLGTHIAGYAGQVMQAGHVADFEIQVSPYGSALPLLGAARHLPSESGAAVALDFGGTAIKRAHVTLERGRITALQRLPDLAAHWNTVEPSQKSARRAAQHVLQSMIAAIVTTWHEAQLTNPPPASVIPVSIAAYVKDGIPLTGVFAQTSLVADSLQDELGRRVSAEIGTPLRILLLHDGTAAAAAYAGQRNTAIVMMGTALGVGFPGDDVGLRQVGEAFC
jgi:hypothetical protein